MLASSIMKKAFDSVWQSGLIYKLYQYGVKGKFFKVIKSMYSSIKSCVKIDGKLYHRIVLMQQRNKARW